MISQQKVAVPHDVQRFFTLYEQGRIMDSDLISLLRGELSLHVEFPTEIREKISGVIKKLERDIEAREMCKAETGIAAVATEKERKIEW